MADTSPETLKVAVQALYGVRAVEGPPGDDGLRTVWHLGPEGAELLSLVDGDGRVRRQELTLLDDHCVWSSGQGVRTGRVERGGGSPRNQLATVVEADPQLVPHRLVRAAQALASYAGQDRYILHMQRVLALAREGLQMSEGGVVAYAHPRPSEPTLPSLPPPDASESPEPPEVVLRHGQPLPNEVRPPVSRASEGLVMLAVFGAAVGVAIVLLFWLL